MQYNTEKEKILLNEYGRNIQKLVDHAKTIKDDHVRNIAARQIITAMKILNPKIHTILDYEQILWTHLAMMANFELDVEFPFPILQKEVLEKKPSRIEYFSTPIKYRHFGRTIEKLIAKVSEFEDGELKEQFVKVITNHMKKTYLTWNKEVVQDEVIFESLEKLSDGKLKPKDGYRLPRAYEIISKTKKRTRRPRNK